MDRKEQFLPGSSRAPLQGRGWAQNSSSHSTLQTATKKEAPQTHEWMACSAKSFCFPDNGNVKLTSLKFACYKYKL